MTGYLRNPTNTRDDFCDRGGGGAFAGFTYTGRT